MCFSPAASFISGAVLSAGGTVTVKKARKKNELPFASIPFLFGVQQLLEGIVWISLNYPSFNNVAVFGYLMFAHVLWPVFTPYAVLQLEDDALRRKILYLIQLIGVTVGLVLLYFMTQQPLTAQIMDGHLVYPFNYLDSNFLGLFYLVATCGSCLVSRRRVVNIFGFAVLIFSFISFYFAQSYISTWCFFSAILSVIVYWHFRTSRE